LQIPKKVPFQFSRVSFVKILVRFRILTLRSKPGFAQLQLLVELVPLRKLHVQIRPQLLKSFFEPSLDKRVSGAPNLVSLLRHRSFQVADLLVQQTLGLDRLVVLVLVVFVFLALLVFVRVFVLLLVT